MPLLGVVDKGPNGPTNPTTLQTLRPDADYLIFYSSVNQNDEMWCPVS